MRVAALNPRLGYRWSERLIGLPSIGLPSLRSRPHQCATKCSHPTLAPFGEAILKSIRAFIGGTPARGATPSLLLRLLEIAQIGRCLVLLGRHQIAVRAQEIAVLADAYQRVVFLA